MTTSLRFFATAVKSSVAGETVTVVSAVAVSPTPVVPVKRNTSGVAAPTAGAVKLAVAVLALFSVTLGPLTWVQPTVSALALAVPCSVTVLPADAVAEFPAVTVTDSRVSRSLSSSQPASSTPPNTAVVIAVRPPRSVWRRE